MNLRLVSIIFLFLTTALISAKDISEPKILNLANIPNEISNLTQIKLEIEKQDPDIICIFNNEFLFSNDVYHEIFGAQFCHIFQDLDHLFVILSKYELSDVKFHDLGTHNTLVEIASEKIPHIIVNGHLPSYSNHEIDTLKSYLIATNPYLKFLISGDLAQNNMFEQNDQYLILPCKKREFEISVSGNTKGETEVKVDASLSSDDNSKTVHVEGKFSQNEKGETNAEAKATLKFEY